VADLAIGSQCNRKHGVAIVHVREVEAHASLTELESSPHPDREIIGKNMSGVGDLHHAIGTVGRRAQHKKPSARQMQASAAAIQPQRRMPKLRRKEAGEAT